MMTKRKVTGTWSVHAAALLAVVVVVTLAFSDTILFAQAQPADGGNAAQGAPSVVRGQNRYRATRPIVVDRETGRRRMPTGDELGTLVDTLTALTKRPADAAQAQLPSGAVSVDLEGGFAGVMLARPAEDGTFETLCVFTFEEAAEFLGVIAEAR